MADYYKGSPYQDVRDYSGKKKKKKKETFKQLDIFNPATSFNNKVND
jgi:hypothetical protein